MGRMAETAETYQWASAVYNEWGQKPVYPPEGWREKQMFEKEKKGSGKVTI